MVNSIYDCGFGSSSTDKQITTHFTIFFVEKMFYIKNNEATIAVKTTHKTQQDRQPTHTPNGTNKTTIHTIMLIINPEQF